MSTLLKWNCYIELYIYIIFYIQLTVPVWHRKYLISFLQILNHISVNVGSSLKFTWVFTVISWFVEVLFFISKRYQVSTFHTLLSITLRKNKFSFSTTFSLLSTLRSSSLSAFHQYAYNISPFLPPYLNYLKKLMRQNFHFLDIALVRCSVSFFLLRKSRSNVEGISSRTSWYLPGKPLH